MADNSVIRANSVVLTTGTFLAGRCHIGQEGIDAGRFMRHDHEDDVLEKGGKFGELTGTDKAGYKIAIEPASNAMS